MKSLDSMTLHELGQARNVLDVFVAIEEGAVDLETESLLDKLEGTTHAKVQKWGLFLLGLQGEAAIIKAEEDRLKARREAVERAYARSKAQLQYEMTAQGLTDVRGPLATVAIALNNPKVVGDVDAGTLTDWFENKPATLGQFVRHKESYEVDRSAILEAFKANEPIPDGFTVIRTSSLRIR